MTHASSTLTDMVISFPTNGNKSNKQEGRKQKPRKHKRICSGAFISGLDVSNSYGPLHLLESRQAGGSYNSLKKHAQMQGTEPDRRKATGIAGSYTTSSNMTALSTEQWLEDMEKLIEIVNKRGMRAEDIVLRSEKRNNRSYVNIFRLHNNFL